jgi:beta-lactamase regulating signal transducer with metallopeptidase domain
MKIMTGSLLTYLLEASICLIGFYLFYRLVLAKEPSFTRNRFYLLIVSAFSLIIPLLDLADYRPVNIPDVYLPLVADFSLAAPAATDAAQAPEKRLTDYLLYAYAAGVVLCVLLFIIRLGKLVRLIRSSHRQRKPDYVLVDIPKVNGPFSFLHYLCWDSRQALSLVEQQQIISHELAHIRDRHSLDVLYMEMLGVVFWFNPVVYAYKKSLQAQHEFAADRSVLQQYDRRQYTRLLVNQSLRPLNLNLTHNFNQSFIKKRITMMNQPNPGKPGWLKVAFVLPLFALLFFVFALKGGSRELLLPDNEVHGIAQTQSEPDPRLRVRYFVEINGVLEELDIRKGIRLADFPAKLQLRPVPDPAYAEANPGEARYRISKFSVSLVKGKQVTKSEHYTTGGNLNNISGLKSMAMPGDHLVVQIEEAQQLVFEKEELAKPIPERRGNIRMANVHPQYAVVSIPIL